MLINKRHQNSIKRAATYSGADIESDPLIEIFKFREKQIVNKKQEQNISLSSSIFLQAMQENVRY